MIKVYSGFKGFTVFLFFVAAIVLLGALFFWGVTKASQLLLPFLSVVSYALIVVFLIFIFPFSYNQKFKPVLSRYCVTMSNVLGVTSWMMAFLFVVNTFGFWGILLAFLFKLLAPLAVISATVKSSWSIVRDLMVWIMFTYIMRFYSVWLLKSNERPFKKGRVIDIEIER